MTPAVALALLIASLSDHDLLMAYQAAAQAKDPKAGPLGEALIRRLHAAAPDVFTKEMCDAALKARGAKGPTE